MANTIGFGFKVGQTDEVLSFGEQGRFIDEVVAAVEIAGGEVIFVGQGHGKYQPTDGGHVIDEPGACVVFTHDESTFRWGSLRLDLWSLTHKYHQEAIALTTGRTEFLNHDGTAEDVA